MSTYQIGDVVRMSATFEDENGDPGNPTTVTLSVLTPLKQVIDLSDQVTQDDDGAFHCDYQVHRAGRYVYRWRGDGDSGTLQASSPDKSFNVQASVFP